MRMIFFPNINRHFLYIFSVMAVMIFVVILFFDRQNRL